MFVHVYIHHFDKLTATGAVSAREEEGGGRRRREEEGVGGRRTVAHARVHACSIPCTDQSCHQDLPLQPFFQEASLLQL